jgi:hypothetical protein
MVVSEDYPTTAGWDEMPGANVAIDDEAMRAEWDETRLALHREGVRIYIRGPLCDPEPADVCFAKAPAKQGRFHGVLLRVPPGPKPAPIPSPF